MDQTAQNGENLRYPVGRYQPPESISAEQREEWIGNLQDLPQKLTQAVANLTDTQLDTPYRPGGWTVRQVVHHVPDSHMHSYVRFRLALTEDAPTARPYDEAVWAELPDAKRAPIQPSLQLLDALHARWVFLLRSLDERDFGRTLKHPEWGEKNLDWLLGLYSWHSRHHVAHIANLRSRNGW